MNQLHPSESNRFEDYDEIVKRLESELAIFLTSKTSLEQEIEIIVNSHGFQDVSLVFKLPIELIVEILYPVVKAEPRCIGMLMLVCRAWCKAIINTPRLWNSIHVIVPPHLERIDAITAFCETAVRRSGQAPLDIKLDYSRLPDFDLEYFAKTEKDWIAPGVKYSFSAWRSQFISIDALSHPLLQHLVPLVLKPLVILSGKDGVFMSRWHSFNLIADKFWWSQSWGRSTLPRVIFRSGILGRPTPLLEKLNVQYLGIQRGFTNMLWNRPATWKTGTQAPFPDLSQATTLSLLNVEIPINNMRIDPSRLEHLDVLCCDLGSYRFALKCQNVTSLNIGLHNRVMYDQSIFNDITHLPFHQLRHLRLSHRPPNSFWRAIDAPHLEVLVFEDFFATHSTVEWRLFPKLSQVEFRWPYMHNAATTFLRPLLINLATRCPLLETLVCTKLSGAFVKKLLRETKGVGYDFKSLETMIMISPNYNETVRETEDMISWLA
jgi:hypothetical protein